MVMIGSLGYFFRYCLASLPLTLILFIGVDILYKIKENILIISPLGGNFLYLYYLYSMGLVSLEGTLPAGSNLIYTRPPGLTVANTVSIRLQNPAVNSVTVRKVKAVGPVTTSIYTVNLAAGDILTDAYVYSFDVGDQLYILTTAPGTQYIVLIQEY